MHDQKKGTHSLSFKGDKCTNIQNCYKTIISQDNNLVTLENTKCRTRSDVEVDKHGNSLLKNELKQQKVKKKYIIKNFCSIIPLLINGFKLVCFLFF